MNLTYSDKLALIREYKNQGGKGSYLSLLQSYPEGGNITSSNTGKKDLQDNRGDGTLYRNFSVEQSDPIFPHIVRPPTQEDYEKELIKKGLKKLGITNPPKSTSQKLKEIKNEFMDVIDIPQKALVYGLTAATRGRDEARFVTPSIVIREDWENNNSYVNNFMDLALDPLNLLTAPVKYGLKGEKIVNPFIKNLLRTITTTDNIDDIYNNETNPKNTTSPINVQTLPVKKYPEGANTAF